MMGSGRGFKYEGRPRLPIMATNDDCLRALRRAATELGESPSKAKYEALGFTPSASTILRHCGGWNAAKEEAGLETNTSTGSRTLPKPDDVELPDGTVWEELSLDQRWHHRHKARSRERTAEWKRHLRRWVFETKRNSDGCVRCGESDPRCLEYHHHDPDEKESNVNETVLFGWSKDRIRAEIEKCDILCVNCHLREHHARQQWMERVDDGIVDDGFRLTASHRRALLRPGAFGLTKGTRLRLWTYAYQREFGCSECGLADPVRLQFHHATDTKNAGVGELIGDSAPTSEVLREVGLCAVLCANCHRRKHHTAL